MEHKVETGTGTIERSHITLCLEFPKVGGVLFKAASRRISVFQCTKTELFGKQPVG